MWGILFGGYFGNIVDIVSAKFFGKTVTPPALWFVPLNEPMKLLLFSQLNRDLDVVGLLFHELDERTMDFRFVAVLSDGAEQYAAMPGAVYQRLHEDVENYLYTPGGDFARIDMNWAHDALELLHELG